MSDSRRLDGKAVIVTGSTTGIGAAIARRCAAEGARILVHGLEPPLAAAMQAELGPAASTCIADLADPAAPALVVAAALAAFGKIDVIVNNAATTQRASLEQTTAEVFDRIIGINLRAPLLLVREALPHLKASRGSVLNIGSVNAYCGEKRLVPYSISKGGLMTLTRNLSDSLAPSFVRVNQMNLGWVLTDNENKLKLAEGLPADWADHPPAGYAPSGRLLSPEQVANLAIYWIGDESRPISGTIMEFEQYPIIGRNPPKVVFDRPQSS